MDRTFSVNHPMLFLLAGLAIAAVLLQSVVFLIKAWKRARELGYAQEKLKKIAVAAVLFSLAPAVAIGIGIITLSGTLGLPLPWLRLSVVGALVYELSAANTAAGALGVSLGNALTAQQFTTIAWTMTVGIMTGVILIPVFCRKYTNRFTEVGKKDAKWGELFTTAIFMGLIGTFVGNSLADVTVSAAGRLSAAVLVVSALVMLLCGFFKKKFNWAWMNDYALPICMLLSMAAAIPLAKIIR